MITSIGWIDTNPSVVTTGVIIDSETYGLTLIERQDIDTTTSCVIRILQRLAILLNLVQRDVVPARVAVPAIIRVISPRRVAAALAKKEAAAAGRGSKAPASPPPPKRSNWMY